MCNPKKLDNSFNLKSCFDILNALTDVVKRIYINHKTRLITKINTYFYCLKTNRSAELIH